MIDIKIEKSLTFHDLTNECWSGALRTLNRIEEENKEDGLMTLLNDIFYDAPVDMTKLNDFLWFDTDYIYESLGIIIDE